MLESSGLTGQRGRGRAGRPPTGLNPVTLPQCQPNFRASFRSSRLPPPSYDQLARDIKAAWTFARAKMSVALHERSMEVVTAGAQDELMQSLDSS